MAVKIEWLQFTPTDIVQLTDPSAYDPLPPTSDRMVLRFTKAHNTADDPAEKHHVYERSLKEPATLPAATSTDLVIEIENTAHVGYALEGDAKLLTESAETLDVPQVRVVFVPSPEDSI